MKKLTTLLSALAVSVALSSAHAEEKVIKLGTEGAYPPFNAIDKDKNLIGFDIDIGNALCESMKAKCEWVTSDWDGIIPALNAKKFDALIASMSITDERKQKIDFTNKYYSTPIKCARAKGTDIDPTNLDGLKDKVVTVQGGVVGENFVNGQFKDIVEVKAYGTQEEANMDVINGRADMTCADSVVLAEFLASDNGKDLEFVGPDYGDKEYVGEGIGIGIRKGDNELKAALNKAIDDIRASGKYKEIQDKYFDFNIYGAELAEEATEEKKEEAPAEEKKDEKKEG